MELRMKKKNNIKKGKWIFSICFHIPSFVLYTIFLIVPMITSLYFSLLKWDGVTQSKFIGMANFVDLFTNDRYFKKVIFNTLKSMAAGVCIQLPLALILAYLIKNWLTDPGVVLFSVIMPGIWQYIGYHFIILLAGMQSVPKELIESAYIDGANTVDIFFRIMIPNIKAMIQVCVVICLTGSIKTFDIPYLMTQGGPGAESTFLSIYMYKEAFVDSSIGRGTAVAVCMLILALAVTMIVNRIFAFINRND